MGALSGKMGAVYKEYTPLDKSKEIANFQSGETWTSGAGTQTDDIVNIRLGTKSIKIADNDASAGLLYSDQNSVGLNLSQFESTAVSDTADYIYSVFYVSDATKVTDVQIGFSSEATFDGDPAYTYIITAVVTGWNYVKVKKSAFTKTNMSNWDSVQSNSFAWTSTASARGE